jgi:hypothetical protein
MDRLDAVLKRAKELLQGIREEAPVSSLVLDPPEALPPPENAISMPDPLPEMVAKGEVTSIVRRKALEAGRYLLLNEVGDRPCGIVTIAAAEEVDIAGTDARVEKHKISVEVRKKHFPRARKLFIHEVVKVEAAPDGYEAEVEDMQFPSVEPVEPAEPDEDQTPIPAGDPPDKPPVSGTAVEKASPILTVKLKKSTATEERYVLGIVLEPDVVDSQDDTYDAETVRKSAHGWMERSAKLGLMHKSIIGGVAKEGAAVTVESYLAPVDFEIGGEPVKKGTWLMGVHVLDEDLWNDVKEGRLTGFSIGGESGWESVSDAEASKLPPAQP